MMSTFDVFGACFVFDLQNLPKIWVRHGHLGGITLSQKNH